MTAAHSTEGRQPAYSARTLAQLSPRLLTAANASFVARPLAWQVTCRRTICKEAEQGEDKLSEGACLDSVHGVQESDLCNLAQCAAQGIYGQRWQESTAE